MSEPDPTYVALGDSFSAGTGCEPGEAWTDLVAAAIGCEDSAAQRDYVNLAFDGATTMDVLGSIGETLTLQPDLVTVVCGANDVLGTTRPDLDGLAARLEEVFVALTSRQPAPLVLTATYPTSWGFVGLGPRTSARISSGIEFVNRTLRMLAARHGARLVEVSGHPGLGDPRNFAADGLHPSPLGHRRAARGFLAELRAAGFESTIEEEIACST
jgi:lysophospholipase L1-like esterase